MLSILWIVLIVIASLVFSNVYWSCVLYTLCCQFSGLSLFWLPLWYSLTFTFLVLCLVYLMLSILWIVLIVIASLVFSNVYLSCVLYLMLSILWIVLIYCLFGLTFILVYLMLSILDCPYCTLCCQFSGLSLFWLPLWYSLTFICPVSCIPYVVNSLDCPYCDCLFGIL